MAASISIVDIHPSSIGGLGSASLSIMSSNA